MWVMTSVGNAGLLSRRPSGAASQQILPWPQKTKKIDEGYIFINSSLSVDRAYSGGMKNSKLISWPLVWGLIAGAYLLLFPGVALPLDLGGGEPGLKIIYKATNQFVIYRDEAWTVGPGLIGGIRKIERLMCCSTETSHSNKRYKHVRGKTFRNSFIHSMIKELSRVM